MPNEKKEMEIPKLDSEPPSADEDEAYSAPTKVGVMAKSVVQEMLRVADASPHAQTPPSSKPSGPRRTSSGLMDMLGPPPSRPQGPPASGPVEMEPPPRVWDEDEAGNDEATVLSAAAKPPESAPQVAQPKAIAQPPPQPKPPAVQRPTPPRPPTRPTQGATPSAPAPSAPAPSAPAPIATPPMQPAPPMAAAPMRPPMQPAPPPSSSPMHRAPSIQPAPPPMQPMQPAPVMQSTPSMQPMQPMQPMQSTPPMAPTPFISSPLDQLARSADAERAADDRTRMLILPALVGFSLLVVGVILYACNH